MANSNFEDIEKQKRENYKTAREDILKALDSVRKLDPQQQQNLRDDILQVCAFKNFIDFVNNIRFPY